MRETVFLRKLRKEGDLQIVEPSATMASSYGVKSESYLESAKLLIEHGKLEEAVSMAYYSMYYMALAVLFRVGVKCENHTAAGLLLELVLDIDASDLKRAKKERVDKQYYVDFAITQEEVEELIRTAEEFDSRLQDSIDRMTGEEIQRFRKTSRTLLNGRT
jgi:uncharacterized protein (UPF0332 family)